VAPTAINALKQPPTRHPTIRITASIGVDIGLITAEATANGIATKAILSAAFRYADRERTRIKLRHPTSAVDRRIKIERVGVGAYCDRTIEFNRDITIPVCRPKID
jgi:hypothetical protein